MPIIYFYIHPYFWPKCDVPSDPDRDWSGFGFGIYTWTIQTYLRLVQSGFECKLVSSVPSEGILIAHRECLSSINGSFKEVIKPTNKLYVVNMSADLGLYSYANLHIVQSCYQSTNYNNCHFVPHWPQPGIIHRDPTRSATFKNIAFLGNNKNLAPEFKSTEWCDEIKKLNLNFIMMDQKFSFDNPESYFTTGIWNNYSEIDAIVAVRKFNVAPHYCALNKPASKLYNAWLSGVPAIIGRDYQCNQERKSEFDYVEVDNVSETIMALRKMKDDYQYRKALVQNGLRRSEEVKADMTVDKWKTLFIEEIIPDYNRWIEKSSIGQQRTIAYNIFNIYKQRLSNKVCKVLSLNNV